jgi:hypothetical protein
MLEYFLTKEEITRPLVTFPNLNLIKDAYKKELTYFKEYMYTSDKRVNNNNFLVKAMLTMLPSIDLPLEEYYKYCKTNIEYGKDISGFITNSSSGDITKNNFYIRDSFDAFRLIDKGINIINLEDWKTLSIIRVLYTNNTSINFYSYGLKDLEDFDKFTIFEVDMVELLIAYKFWALDRRYLELDTHPSSFLATYVYPKVWDTMLDLTILNRFFCLYQNIELDKSKQALPYSIINYESKVDDYLGNCLTYIKKNRLYLDQILDTVLYINYKHTDNLYINGIFTSRSRWVLWLSRLKLVTNLYGLMSENRSIGYNKLHFSRLEILLRRYRNRYLNFPTNLPATQHVELDFNVEILKNKDI